MPKKSLQPQSNRPLLSTRALPGPSRTGAATAIAARVEIVNSPQPTLAACRMRSLRRVALGLLLLGLAWRVLRFLLQFPIWGDEAYLAVNFLDRDYLGLTGPLRWVQVAPILFLWGELTVYHLLGGTELALRLLPLLAGLGSLALFWRLARLALPPAPRYLAVGVFAVSYYPMRHCCEVKPYAGDLLVALALLVVTLTWLRRPERLRWLVLLVVLAPIVLAASYPAVFVAGAVTVVLLPVAWRQGHKACWLYVAYNVLMAAGFLVPYLLAGVGQFQSTGGTANDYWADWFPPAAPGPLLAWLVRAHTGNMLAYPVGGPNGASILTLLLCLLGGWQVLRSGRHALLALLLIPFGLTLVAAGLHRYPYGGSARIAQHLAPAICLLLGAGLWEIIRQTARPGARQRRAALGLGALLAAGSVAGMLYDLYRPYKTPADGQARRLVQTLLARARPEDQVVVRCNGELWPTFEWYLRQAGDRVALDGRVDPGRLTPGAMVWTMSFDTAADRCEVPAAGAATLVPVGRHSYVFQFGRIEGTRVRCQVVQWRVRPDKR